MTPRNAPPNWLPYAGFLLAVGSMVYTAGAVGAQVKSNTERITKLEASDEARSDGLSAINVRTARIEAKLDFLMPGREAEGERERRGPAR